MERPSPGSAPSSAPARILLVGFMGSGKSAVGARLARMLRWGFRDMDREVERKTGRSIPELFRDEGETYFRGAEQAAAQHLLSLDRVVIAAGGGWPCRPGRLEEIGPETLSIWLRVSPEVAVRRARGGRDPRPLLDVDDPLARARALLEKRERFYDLARWGIDTDAGPPQRVAADLRARLRSEYGMR